jgi:predicted TIM-barrel fold metal-dependent hydrolase
VRYDCHVRVLAPASGRRRIGGEAEADCSLHGLRRLLSRRGVHAAVLVQLQAGEEVHRRLLDSLGQYSDCAYGVAEASWGNQGAEAARWLRDGVRGVWVELPAGRWMAHEQLQAVDAAVPSRWPVELLGSALQLAFCAPLLARLCRNFVRTVAGDAPWHSVEWTRLRWRAEMGNLYFRVLSSVPTCGPLAAALPDRLLWGSGWPSAAVPPAPLMALSPMVDRNARALYGLA